jgi:hypothetical protein
MRARFGAMDIKLAIPGFPNSVAVTGSGWMPRGPRGEKRPADVIGKMATEPICKP